MKYTCYLFPVTNEITKLTFQKQSRIYSSEAQTAHIAQTVLLNKTNSTNQEFV